MVRPVRKKSEKGQYVFVIYRIKFYTYFFDFFDENTCLEKYIIETIEYELSTVDGVKKVGASKLEVWEKLVFHLSLAGLIPLADKVYSIRIEDDNLVKVTTKNSRVARFKFNSLRIFFKFVFLTVTVIISDSI